jgi:signal transducing adaptor molecule
MEAQRAATRYNTGYTAPSSQPSTSYAPARADGYTPTPDKPLPQPASVAPALSTPPVSQQPKPNVRPPIPRARALYDFDPDPNQPGELPLRKGDIVRVLDKTYAEWWRGECKGRVGIFPCNWVEPLPDLSEDQLLAEARSEAAVFAQVGNVDRLLELLRKADATPNPMTAISDDDEVTVRSSVGYSRTG